MKGYSTKLVWRDGDLRGVAPVRRTGQEVAEAFMSLDEWKQLGATCSRRWRRTLPTGRLLCSPTADV